MGDLIHGRLKEQPFDLMPYNTTLPLDIPGVFHPTQPPVKGSYRLPIIKILSH